MLRIFIFSRHFQRRQFFSSLGFLIMDINRSTVQITALKKKKKKKEGRVTERKMSYFLILCANIINKPKEKKNSSFGCARGLVVKSVCPHCRTHLSLLLYFLLLISRPRSRRSSSSSATLSLASMSLMISSRWFTKDTSSWRSSCSLCC